MKPQDLELWIEEKQKIYDLSPRDPTYAERTSQTLEETFQMLLSLVQELEELDQYRKHTLDKLLMELEFENGT